MQLKELKTIILKSDKVFIYFNTNTVQFIGINLEPKEYKLKPLLLNELIIVCGMLGIEYNIY